MGTGTLIFAIAMGLGYSWINSLIFLIGVVMVISRLFNENLTTGRKFHEKEEFADVLNVSTRISVLCTGRINRNGGHFVDADSQTNGEKVLPGQELGVC